MTARPANPSHATALRRPSEAEKSMPMRVLVLADTHMRPGLDRTLPREVWDAAKQADVILHAGDVLTRDLLDQLSKCGPVHAVLGNNDVTMTDELPETLTVDLGGVSLAMIHDSGPRAGRPGRLHRRFPHADIVVYGHSHMPDDSEGATGQRLFNPGSCTERRRAPQRTYGWLELAGGDIVDHQIIPIV